MKLASNDLLFMSAEKKFEKIAKYLSDNMPPEEREDFFAWIADDTKHKELLDDSMEIWEAAEEEDNPSFDIDIDAAWGKVDERIDSSRSLETAEKSLQAISYIRPILQIAAAGLLLLMAGLWYKDYTSAKNETTVVSTQPKERTTIDLPDGSKVWLNENSEIRYQKFFDNRVVHLEGEAFFEVAKKDGQTFEINAQGSKTTVLGTSFNVRAYQKEGFVEVAVETGKVAFSSQSKQKDNVILKPREYAVYNKSTKQLQKEHNPQLNAAAWKKQELDLREIKMAEAVKALERYFNIKIAVENDRILNCMWRNTGSKMTNPDLNIIINQINFANPYSIKKVNTNKYLLSGIGCD